jgi:hypothetical protein
MVINVGTVLTWACTVGAIVVEKKTNYYRTTKME